MKYYNAFFLFLFLMTLLSCNKDDKGPDGIQLDASNLSDCPAGSECLQQYLDQADIVFETDYGGPVVRDGAYRLFKGTRYQGYMGFAFYIKAPMDDKPFELKKKDLIQGRVIYQFSCTTRFSAGEYNIIDGFVKGVPSSTDETAAWLLECQLITQLDMAPYRRDTIYIKQHFYQVDSF